MIIRVPGRIPIVIHGTFWLFAGLIGFLNTHSLLGTLIWMVVIFISVLVHEFGHALTAAAFGQRPYIELVALGGLTYHDGQKLSLWKQFLIVFNGPLFGFSLYLISSYLFNLPSVAGGVFAAPLFLMRLVNLFWTGINLLPIMPLDGGQLLRIVLEKIFGIKGLKYALYTGVVLGLAISLISFLYQQFFLGALFFLFVFQNFDAVRRMRTFSESDRDDTLQGLITRAEILLQKGEKEEAAHLCEEIRAKAKQGLLFSLATQYLAFIKFEKGLYLETYQLLLPIKKELTNDALCLLHKTAFDQRDFPLVVELESSCFQALPTAETALRNALAHAQLKEITPTIGWLKTAIQEGLANGAEILKTPTFDSMRQDPAFEEFRQSLQK
ncbi:MAG TPA: site-2 protease family protein [Rhabdochlamydiaceae bacterium]|jgi:Zn-dependent protease